VVWVAGEVMEWTLYRWFGRMVR